MASSASSSDARGALRARALAIDAERLAIEREIAGCLATLGENATAPLVDAEGFPRADIDVAEVARVRSVLSRLRTDLKLKMKEVESAMLAAMASETAE